MARSARDTKAINHLKALVVTAREELRHQLRNTPTDELVYLKDRPVHPTKLVEALTPLLRGRSEETVFLKGDRDVPYGRVIEVLDLLHRSGIVKVGMVTERPETARR